jgi:DNA-directed RNA polymerase subunit RPC12/RpoP
MSKTEVSYTCPHCSRSTSEARITNDDYTPTKTDRELRPSVQGDAQKQRLHCPCGHVYTWFSAQETTFRDFT